MKINDQTEALKKYAIDLLKRNGKSRQEARKTIRDTDIDEFKLSLKSHVFDEVNKLRIACFSHQPSNLMLWSHYASGHKGICLHFHPELDMQTFGAIHDVEYSEKFNSVVFTPSEGLDESTLQHLIFTKSKVWEMEQELRLFEYSNQEKRHFQTESLKSIIFGFETKEKLKKEILDLYDQPKYRHVKIFQARPRHEEFGINLDLIKIGNG